VTERLAPGVGETFGGYTIESSLGRGGMGAVYLATHARLARKVALKVIAPELADDEEFRARFLRETQLAASLEHPNVIPIYDAGEVDGVLYLAMRYVAGPSLRTLLRERGALSAEETLAIAEQIGGALDAAHAAELVHRDVKPANVLLTESGEHAFLCDFGLAKRSDSRGLTRTGSFLGSVDYAAPEQIEGRPLDGRADVYSLGCVLFHCLTGRAPYVRDTEYAVLHAHVADPAPALSSTRPDLPRALDGVLLKAMAKVPRDRYATGGALAAAFAEALSATRAAPAPPSDDERTVVRPPRRRRRRVVAAVAAVAAAAALGTLVAVLATGGSGSKAPTRTTEAPTLGAVVSQIERILGDSAASRHSIGNVLAAGFACTVVKPPEARRRMDEVVASRRQTLERVTKLGTVPSAAKPTVALLETALRDSIAADVSYRNGFRYATGCPPTSDYFKAAARADRRATAAKVKFVTEFNRLAMRFGRKTWSAAAI
jgi:serine/threonine protein kinase